MENTLADRLKEKKETILSQWEERCMLEVTAAGTVPSLALRDSIPIYLDHLAECLTTNCRMDFKAVFKREERASRIGRMHGADRASSGSYALTEVIFEYHILREVIFQELESKEPLNADQRDILLDSLEQAVNDAAVEFSEIHSEIQQKFVNTLTHDLKNPITSAKMNAELILKRINSHETSKTSAKRIISSLTRLETMIHDLLDASRLRAGETLTLQFSNCDLDILIRDVVEDMSIVHGDRFVFDSHEPVIGHFGCDGIRRAIENLIGNAVKYGTLHSPITVYLKKEKDFVVMSVHNQGSVIPETEIPTLFDQYRRTKNAQETTTGWGLGLTLVKGVVDAHKGKIHVKSSAGKGTSFILEIPYGVAEEQ